MYFVHPLADISLDISTDVLVNISAKCQLIYRSTCRLTLGWYINQDMSVNISTDVSTKISAEWRSTYQLTVGRFHGRYSSRHSANTLTIDCRWSISWLSYNTSQRLKRSLGRCSHYFTFRKHAFKTTEQRWDEVWNTLMQGHSQKKIMTEAISIIKFLS